MINLFAKNIKPTLFREYKIEDIKIILDDVIKSIRKHREKENRKLDKLSVYRYRKCFLNRLFKIHKDNIFNLRFEYTSKKERSKLLEIYDDIYDFHRIKNTVALVESHGKDNIYLYGRDVELLDKYL